MSALPLTPKPSFTELGSVAALAGLATGSKAGMTMTAMRTLSIFRIEFVRI